MDPAREAKLQRRVIDNLIEFEEGFWQPITGEKLPADIKKAMKVALEIVHRRDFDEFISCDEDSEDSWISDEEDDDDYMDDVGQVEQKTAVEQK